MNHVDKETQDSRMRKTRGFATIILFSVGSAIPMVGWVFAIILYLGVFGTIIIKSKTIAKDLIIPVLCGGIFAWYSWAHINAADLKSFAIVGFITSFIASVYAYTNSYDATAE